jgi:hypothetical protein
MVMGQMRQGLSMVILYYSYQYIIKEDLKKFILVVLIAASFHISSLIFLPAYFLVKRRIKISKIIIAFTIIFLINNFFIENFISWIEQLYLSNTSSYLLFKIYVYSMHYVGNYSPMAYYEKVVLAIIIIFTYNNKKIIESIPNYHIMSNIMLLGIFIYLVLIQTFTVIGARGANNFLSFSIFMYPMLLKGTKNSIMKYLIFCLITLYPMIRCLIKLYSEQPYSSFKTFLIHFF